MTLPRPTTTAVFLSHTFSVHPEPNQLGRLLPLTVITIKSDHTSHIISCHYQTGSHQTPILDTRVQLTHTNPYTPPFTTTFFLLLRAFPFALPVVILRAGAAGVPC